MSWRWISISALLGALVLGYAAMTDRNSLGPVVDESASQPGYFLKDAVITRTGEDGSPGLRLSASRIEQLSPDAEIQLHQVRVDYMNAPDKHWILTAREGFVPEDARIVRFSGDVELKPADQTAATFLRTEALEIDTIRNIAYSTQSPVSMQLRNNLLTVKRFEANLTTEAIKLESARGRFIPQ